MRPILALLLATASLFGYSRDLNLHAIHCINRHSLHMFQELHGKAYSLMKYGHRGAIDHFAKTITWSITDRFGCAISEQPEDFRIVVPACKNVPTSAVAIAHKIAEQLDLETVTLRRSITNAQDFGKIKNAEARIRLMEGQFYYDGPSLSGKTLFFIEDAIVSGAHYIESQRILVNQGGARLEDIHAFCIVSIDQELACSFENLLNSEWITDAEPDRMIPILNDPQNLISPRVIRYVVKHPTLLEKVKPQRIQAVFEAAKMDNPDLVL